jgi:hypothetical protein
MPWTYQSYTPVVYCDEFICNNWSKLNEESLQIVESYRISIDHDYWFQKKDGSIHRIDHTSRKIYLFPVDQYDRNIFSLAVEYINHDPMVSIFMKKDRSLYVIDHDAEQYPLHMGFKNGSIRAYIREDQKVWYLLRLYEPGIPIYLSKCDLVKWEDAYDDSYNSLIEKIQGYICVPIMFLMIPGSHSNISICM